MTAELALLTSGTLQVRVDEAERKLYLRDLTTQVVLGDLVTVRGVPAAVTAIHLWAGSGRVVVYLPLPDTGSLLRPTGGGFDQATTTYVEPTDLPTWTGPCLVERTDQGAAGTAGDQVVTTQLLVVSVPWSVADVRPDDVLRLSTSADPHLTGRRLIVVREESASTAGLRRFRVIDNQG